MGNTTEARTIYILLTRSGTWFSRLIHLATADSYTHASIGLDGPIGPFYVAGLLRDSGALELSKPPALVRPADFCQIHQLRTVHQGDMGGLPALALA